MKGLRLLTIVMVSLLAYHTVNLNAKSTTPKPQVTFVELGSVNCIPCKMMQPVMKDIETIYGNKVEVVFYDVWKQEHKAMASKYKIKAIPTQVFLDKDGKEFFRHEGFYPKDEMVKMLDKHLGISRKATNKQ